MTIREIQAAAGWTDTDLMWNLIMFIDEDDSHDRCEIFLQDIAMEDEKQESFENLRRRNAAAKSKEAT